MFSRKDRKRINIKEIEDRTKNEEPLELEKGDLKAIVLAAFATLMPIALAMGGAMLLVYWFMVGRF